MWVFTGSSCLCESKDRAGRTRWKLWATTGVSVIHLTWERSQDFWKTRQHSVISTISPHAVYMLFDTGQHEVIMQNSMIMDCMISRLSGSTIKTETFLFVSVINQQAPGIWPVKTTLLKQLNCIFARCSLTKGSIVFTWEFYISYFESPRCCCWLGTTMQLLC